MKMAARKGKPVWILTSIFLALVAVTILIFNLEYFTIPVSAHSGEIFGPACGAAFLDGIVDPVEWSSAATQTFQMVPSGSEDPFTATLYVMNSGNSLYLGMVINDDEFMTQGTWLPQGDMIRIDFDNDHSGSLFALGDDVLDDTAGSPQFMDGYISSLPSSATSDTAGGGTSDGSGVASRVGDWNHFELRHTLCSGDSLDFCLHSFDTVGFRLEYLDAQANGSFGGSQLFPGKSSTSEADIVIGLCDISDFLLIYLPLIRK